MSIAGPDVAAALERAATALIAARERLNAADARLGDGDTGTMLARSAEAVLRALPGAAAVHPSDVLRAAAEAIAAETGSSLGTLLSLGLRRCARHLAGRDPVTAGDMAAGMAAAATQMRTAGGARPGDKTVVDLVDEMAERTAEGATGAALRAAAVRLMDDYRPRPCRIGRARLYPEASKGADDPGMLAGLVALEAICRDD